MVNAGYTRLEQSLEYQYSDLNLNFNLPYKLLYCSNKQKPDGTQNGASLFLEVVDNRNNK